MCQQKKNCENFFHSCWCHVLNFFEDEKNLWMSLLDLHTICVVNQIKCINQLSYFVYSADREWNQSNKHFHRTKATRTFGWEYFFHTHLRTVRIELSKLQNIELSKLQNIKLSKSQNFDIVDHKCRVTLHGWMEGYIHVHSHTHLSRFQHSQYKTLHINDSENTQMIENAWKCGCKVHVL